MSRDPCLHVRCLTLAYRLGVGREAITHTVLHGVDFDAQKGDYIVVTGPAGAGKTSLLLCIVGLLHPVHGEVRWRIPRARIAYVPAGLNYYSFLTVYETLDYYAIDTAAGRADRGVTIERVLAHVGLTSAAGTRVSELSDSRVRRLRLAHALVARPRALVLDELLSGADAATTSVLARVLGAFTTAGGIVITAETEDAALTAITPSRTVALHPGPKAPPLPPPRNHPYLNRPCLNSGSTTL